MLAKKRILSIFSDDTDGDVSKIVERKRPKSTTADGTTHIQTPSESADSMKSDSKHCKSSPEHKATQRQRSWDPNGKRTRSKTRSKSRSPEDSVRRPRSGRSRRSRDRSPTKYRRYYESDLEDIGSGGRRLEQRNQKVGSRYYDVDPEIGSQPIGKQTETKTRERKQMDLITSKTGGAYIPPAKLRMMQAGITDKCSAAYQRIAWEALKKSIHGHINKVNTSNLRLITRDLLKENVIRGRGLLAKSIIQAQAASPTFTPVYSALVAIINSRFPNIGELLLRRLIAQFKRAFHRSTKVICISAVTFIAHLVNQRVAHEILALEILTLLVETPTDDSIEVAIAFLKECGQKLTEVSSKGINAIFEMLRNILHEGQLEKRIQYMIEVMFQIRKDGFKDHVAVSEELDLVNEDDQFTHLLTLDDVKQADTQDILNVFKLDDNYEQNEGKYKTLRGTLLADSDSDVSGEIASDASGSGSDDDSDEEDGDNGENDEQAKKTDCIIDNTEANLVRLRRLIYLTIQSSLDFEECAHKLMKMELKPGQEIELCHMFLDCCAEQRTYEKFYGLLAQRFCQLNQIYVTPFQQIFADTFATSHRLDTNRLRNVSKFFAHLLFTDAIGWEVLSTMKLNEQDTNSSSRIFIKTLFQELAEYMGLEKLNKRLKDPTLQEHFVGLFPHDSPKNTTFSINFFTSIGLGGLTDELREHLKSVKSSAAKSASVIAASSSSDSSDSESSSSSEEESLESDEEQEFVRKSEEGNGKDKKSPLRNSRRNQRREQDTRSVRHRNERDRRDDKSESNRRRYRYRPIKDKRYENERHDSNTRLERRRS